jgi:hypothetical protein
LPGFYWFATTGRHVPYESRLEMAVLMELDFDLDVTGVTAQPFRLEHCRRGKVVRHVPDIFALLRSGGRRVIDVKPADRVSEPANQEVFHRTRSACAQAGWDYVVATGPDRVVGANLAWLAGYRRSPPDPFDLAARLLAGCDQPTRLGDLARRAGPTPLLRPVLFHLLWSQVLTFDLTQPLGNHTVVSPNAGRALVA